MKNDQVDIGQFIKENLWKVIVAGIMFAGVWATMQGMVKMNSARIVSAEERIDTIEDTLQRLILLEERQAENRQDILEIKAVVKEIDEKMDMHILNTR